MGGDPNDYQKNTHADRFGRSRRDTRNAIYRKCFGQDDTNGPSPHALTATIEDDFSPLVVGRKLEDLLAPGRGINEQARDLCVMSGR